jgi:hypothetical protein
MDYVLLTDLTWEERSLSTVIATAIIGDERKIAIEAKRRTFKLLFPVQSRLPNLRRGYCKSDYQFSPVTNFTL